MKIKFALYLVVIIVILTACDKTGGINNNGDNNTSDNTPTKPVLTTSSISQITDVTAICGGNITSDGGSSIIARGVCWNTSQYPTTANNKTTDGNGTGTFSSSLTGLAQDSKYYVRAYATNSVGTMYGNEQSFNTAKVEKTVIDVDGNVYNILKIGIQTWMIENLKTTKYNDGTLITNITDNTVWSNLTTGAYCWYNNGISYKNTYGAMYNWYSVKTGKLAPTGWHVPTDADWEVLTTFLGGDSIAGAKLKEAGTSHWNAPNLGATNEVGFNALPGGYRNTEFVAISVFGYWWSATEISSTNAWYRYMRCDDKLMRRINYTKSSGFSVRCIKD